MKINRMKTIRVVLAVVFLAMQPLVATMFGCGSSGGSATPPITLPAPTGGYMNTTAPDADGNVLVYGYIYADGKAVPNVDVDVANSTTGGAASTTADASAYFSVGIAASVGDSLAVTYTDPTTGETSEGTDLPVSSSRQPMSSATTFVHDVDYNSSTGYAVAVTNDGTNSQLIEIDPADGSIHARASFAGKLFDRVSVHSSFNYAAVLDVTNKTLYWYNLTNLADEMAPGDSGSLTDPSAVYDVAVVDLDDTPFTTDDLIVVSHEYHDYGVGDISFMEIYTVDPSGTWYHAGVHGFVAYPTDPTYPNFSMTNTPTLRATKIDFIKTADNWPRLAMVAEYENAKAVQFISFQQTSGTGTPVSINTTIVPLSQKSPHGAVIDAILDPYAIKWYSDNIALMTNSATNALYTLDTSNASTALFTVSSPLTVGTKPRGIATDSAGNRAFVANEDDNNVVNVNMTSFDLTGTSYEANYSPTYVIYYRDSTVKKIGVALTEPVPMFGTIDVTE